MIDLLEIVDFMDAAACGELRTELRQVGGSPATLLGRSAATAVEPQVRRVTRGAIPPGTRERVTRLLMER
jgi:SM-20-related protein